MAENLEGEGKFFIVWHKILVCIGIFMIEFWWLPIEKALKVIDVILCKGERGFGFTIVGGDDPGEMIQINAIVATG